MVRFSVYDIYDVDEDRHDEISADRIQFHLQGGPMED